MKDDSFREDRTTDIQKKTKNTMFEFTLEGGNDDWFEKKCQQHIDDENTSRDSDDDQVNELPRGTYL